MGCNQSKPADVSTGNAIASVAKKVEPQTKELKTEELEAEERQTQDEEPADKASTILEPIAPTIDTSVTEQQAAPDSSAVDVPDSVRANFSSFNISFIDPTVSAPTSATTEPNVTSTRVTVITEETVSTNKDETLTVEAADKEMEPIVAESPVNTTTEEIAAEQVEREMVEEQVEELAATIEGFAVGMEPVEAEVVMEPLAAGLKEEIVVEEQIDVETEAVEVFSGGLVASANIEEESGTTKTVEEVEERPFGEAKEPIAAVAETVAASEERGTAVSTTEKGDEPLDDVAPVDEEKSAESVVVNVAELAKEEKVAEPVKEKSLAQSVVEKGAEPVVENVVDCVKEQSAFEPVKDENEAAESVMEKVISKEVVQKVAEPVVGEKSVDLAKEKTDGESVKSAGVTAAGEIAVPAEESDVADKAITVVKEPATIIEEPVAVAMTNQTEAVVETRPTVENKPDGSPPSEDGIEAEDSDVEQSNVADKPASAFISDNKEAAELQKKETTRAK